MPKVKRTGRTLKEGEVAMLIGLQWLKTQLY
jgi:hypothetical protein